MEKKLKTYVEIAEQTLNRARLDLSKQIEAYIMYFLKNNSNEYDISDIVETSNGDNGTLKSRCIKIDEFDKRVLLYWYDEDILSYEIAYLTDEDISIQKTIFDYLSRLN